MKISVSKWTWCETEHFSHEFFAINLFEIYGSLATLVVVLWWLVLIVGLLACAVAMIGTVLLIVIRERHRVQP